MTIYDISVPVVNGGVVYAGNPEIQFTPQQSIAKGDGANVTALSFGSHTGTHVDAPKHFFDDGRTVDQLSLDGLMGPAGVVSMPDSVMAVGKAELERALAERNITLVLIEHVLRLVVGISDKLVVLNGGMKLAEGSPKEVVADPRVIEAYLGRGFYASREQS